MTSTVPLRVVPDEVVPGAAEVYVTVSLSGREYDLILDTGGASTRIVADDVTRTFEPASPQVERGRGVFGTSTPAPRVIVPELRLGDITITGLVVDISNGAASSPPAILGLDVLRHHRLDLRLGQGTLTLDGSDPVDQERPLRMSSRGHPYLDVTWAGHTAHAIWDTGAGVTVVDTAFARAHRHLFAPRATAVGVDSQGNSSEAPLVTMAACSIGGRSFAAGVAAVADIAGIQRPGDPPFDLIVGYPVISQTDWSFDLRNGRWGFLDHDVNMPADRLEFRLASPTDAGAMRALVRAAYQKYVPRIGREPGPMTADYEAIAASGRALLVWDGGTLVGLLVTELEDDALLIDNVAVSPDHQGTGLGSRLIATAEEQAMDAVKPTVRLYTHVTMTENIELYARRGFVETHRATDHGFMRVFMSKQLPPTQ